MPIIYEPVERIKLLERYIYKKIDAYPDAFISFDEWLIKKYPIVVYGTPQYYRAAATHCFYCECKFSKCNNRTIDHFFPISKGEDATYGKIFVIACEHCNRCKKKDMMPDDFIRLVTVANMTGHQLNGYSRKDLSSIAKNVNKIFNDTLMGVNKTIYWLTKSKDFIPKGFYEINQGTGT